MIGAVGATVAVASNPGFFAGLAAAAYKAVTHLLVALLGNDRCLRGVSFSVVQLWFVKTPLQNIVAFVWVVGGIQAGPCGYHFWGAPRPIRA